MFSEYVNNSLRLSAEDDGCIQPSGLLQYVCKAQQCIAFTLMGGYEQF
jgi:hypothetical protein